MEIGLVTYTPEIVKGYDYHVYYSKWVNGSIFPAARGMQNDVTCFCDAKAIREKPEIAAISKEGPALRKNRKANLAFDYVCPTNQEYRNKVIDYIKELNKELQIFGLFLVTGKIYFDLDEKKLILLCRNWSSCHPKKYFSV